MPFANSRADGLFPVERFGRGSLFWAAILIVFWQPLFGGASFLIRDAAHFYPPQWEWAQHEWRLGRIPLWNPYQNLGEPHLADSTSSVLYPGKLMFALPLNFRLLYNWYLVLHLGLAAFNMYGFVRSRRGSADAAGLAAISYAFSGTILFAYSNAPFLVGGAWLPLALNLSAQLVTNENRRSVVPLAMVLALVVLGGDPQLAYEIVLLLALLIWQSGRVARKATDDGKTATTRSLHRLGYASAACGLAVLLAAVQVLPSVVKTVRSERAAFDSPRSVYEALQVGTIPTNALLGHAGTVAGQPQRTYDFSVGPWRWLELLWPNIGGRMFPQNSRWMSALSAEGRVWTPSLYLGLIPAVLAIRRLGRLRSLPPVQYWLAISTLIALFGGLGVYGLGWLLAEFRGLRGQPPVSEPLGWAFGGIYWFMTLVLPGFAQFRYPAKLWTLATLGLSFLAAAEWDHQKFYRGSHGVGRVFIGLAGMSMALLLMLLFMKTPFVHFLALLGVADEVFGPLDGGLAHRDCLWACGQSAAVAAIAAMLLQWRTSIHQATAGRLLLLITLVELIFAHSWLVATAVLPAVRVPTESTLPPERVVRTAERLTRPATWETTSSPGRLCEVVTWDRQHLFPHYQIYAGKSLWPATTTIKSLDLEILLAELEQQPPDALADKIKTALSAAPRAWIVHEITRLPPLRSSSPDAVRARIRQIWFSQPRDFFQEAVVESDALADFHPAPSQITADESCQVSDYGPQRTELAVKLRQPGLIVLGDSYDPGWKIFFRKAGSATWVTAAANSY